MVTRRQGLIGAFAALGLGAVGGATWWLTRPPEIDPPMPMPASMRPRLGVQYAVINATTGEPVLESYADVRRQPASLTKMMAMAVVFKAMSSPDTRFNLQSDVIIPEYIRHVRNDVASFDNLTPGDKYKAETLLMGAGSRSDAFSTIALALHMASATVYNWAGTESEKATRFIAEMNNLAAEIGMSDSHFAVITGSPNRDNLSTPRDIARLIAYIDTNFPRLAEITFGRPSFDIEPASASRAHSSKLLRAHPSEIEYAKTGYTDLAGYCLGVKARMGTHPLIAVVFGAPSDAKRNEVMYDILTRAAAKLDAEPVMASAPAPSVT